MSAFRILVADDHPIFRFGLCALLASHEGWEVCGEAVDGRDAVEKCKRLKPDLLILDICLPNLNGVEAARQILKANRTQKILVITNVDSEQVIRDCLEAGVRGWVFKSEGVENLTTAVEGLQRDKYIFSSSVSHLIMDGYLMRHQFAPAEHTMRKLSPREREVLQLLAEGKTTKEVAVMLDMSVKTADTHRSNLMRKLDIHSIAGLVLYAVKNEIVVVQRPPGLRLPQPGNGQAGIPS